MNAPKHTVTILRRLLGLKQSALAIIVGRTTNGIQKVEYLEMPLSESLAEEISRQTNVSVAWLLENDLSKPAIDTLGLPYTKETFEERQASLSETFGARPIHAFTARFWLLQGMTEIIRAASAAMNKGSLGLFAYKYGKAVESLCEQFGSDEPIGQPVHLRTGITGDKNLIEAVEKDFLIVLERIYRKIDASIKQPGAAKSFQMQTPKARSQTTRKPARA